MTTAAESARAPGRKPQATVGASIVDGTCVLTLRGELDMTNADEVSQDLRRGFDSSGSRPVTLDLSGLTFLGSEGIRVLIKLYRHVDASGSRMTLAHPTPMVRRILDVTGVSQMLPLI